MDVAKEMKEKTGWVTYFAKHLEQVIDIVHKKTDDARLANNLQFCTKFFDRYELVYNRIVLGERKSIDIQAVLQQLGNNSLNGFLLQIEFRTRKNFLVFGKNLIVHKRANAAR